MQLYGLIGKSLGHSFSEQWFSDFFKDNGIEASYRLFELETLDSLPALVEANPDLRGLNVTLPYKREVVDYCSWLAPEVRATGAANCIRIEHGVLEAYNTDADGFSLAFEQIPGERKFNGAMILGTGGGAAAAAFVLRNKKVPIIFVSRDPDKNPGTVAYHKLTEAHFDYYSLIINATPVGMWPSVDETPPLPYELLQGHEMLYDMIYNPHETGFMREGAKRGCYVQNGLGMLHRQAARSWEIWNNNR